MVKTYQLVYRRKEMNVRIAVVNSKFSVYVEVHLVPYETSIKELFAKTVNEF